MTQIEMIKNHLRTVGEITSMDAFREYGCTRLAAVIFKIKKQGWNILSVDETGKNRFGNSVTYTRYVLVVDGEKNEQVSGN